MGYYSEVRILMEEESYNKLCEISKAKCKTEDDYDIMASIDIKQERTGKDENDKKIKYIYFGWDNLKWYEGHCEYVDLVHDFLLELDEYHFIRIGENWDDLVEDYHLNKTDVDCIGIIRGFDEIKEEQKS